MAFRLIAILLLIHASVDAQTPVSVYQDEGGVPHIVSTNERGVMWALGRQHMLDFPVSTAFHLRYASGELARRLGIIPALNEHWIRVDISNLLWRIPERVATLHRPAVMGHPVFGPALQAYVDGVNAGRDIWNADPVLRAQLAGNTAGFTLTANQIEQLLTDPFMPDHVLQFALAWPGFGARAAINGLIGQATFGTGSGFTASNGWMVSPNASASGRPMLLSDPHLPAESPSFYRGPFATLHGGPLDVAGWFFPGLPYPVLGFNRNLAWTATSNAVDHHDVWIARTASPTTYLVGGLPNPISRTMVSIPYTNLATGALLSRTVELAWVDSERNLPILEEAVQSSGPDYSHILFAGATFVTAPETLFQFLGRMAHANTLRDVRAAVETLSLHDQNLLVLHRTGDMGYWWLARAPLRAPLAPPIWQLSGVLDGNDPSTRWLVGVHPASTLPHESYVHGPNAPPEIWINNNVLPEHTRPPGFATVSSSNFPHGMVRRYPAPTWRQHRARELLVPPVTSSEHDAAALDEHDSWARAVVPYFERSLTESAAAGMFPSDPLSLFLLQHLGGWTGNSHRQSIEAAFVYLLRAKYEQLLGWNVSLGSPVPVDPRIANPFIDLPALGSFSALSHPGDVFAMALAVQLTLYELYPHVLASAPTGSTALAAPFAPSALWMPGFTPSPWAGVGPVLELGQIKALNLTPPFAAAGTGAYYPVGGAKDSLFQTGTLDIAGTLSETYAGTQIVQASARNEFLNGSTRLFTVEFAPNGPVARYLTPVGPTEIASDPRRYLPAQAYAARQLKPLHFDLATIMAPQHAIQVTPLVAP